MPRYDDKYANTRLYIGNLSSRIHARDLERAFSRYGRIRDVNMKHDFAFVDFSDPRDADDARYHLDGRDFDGRHIIVEFAKGVQGRGSSPGSGRCFNCGLDGHWARDCKAGDWKNKCYRCGERGHIERNCKNSPKKLRRGGSYSLSPVRSRSPRRHSRSYRRGGSYSLSPVRSRSPRRHSPSYSGSPTRRTQSPIREDRSESPRHISLETKSSPPPSSTRRHSPSPDNANPRKSHGTSPSNSRLPTQQDGSDGGERSGSPASPARDSEDRDNASPKNNGNNHSHSPRDDNQPPSP